MAKLAKKTSKSREVREILTSGKLRLVGRPNRNYVAVAKKKIADANKRGIAMKEIFKKRAAMKPLAFYAKVEVKERNGVPSEAVGTKGIVLGRARKNGQWNYSVFLGGLNESYSLPHAALRPTGEVLQRCEIYGGEVMKVTVDEAGTGTIAAN